MPRPVKPRWIEHMPEVTYFKPAGVPMSILGEVSLGVDELEAIRLKDSLGLEQEECAARMGVAQSTFQRILTAARQKLAGALIEGKAIRIEGGHYRFMGQSLECSSCGHKWIMSPDAKGVETGDPKCPKCGSNEVVQRAEREENAGNSYESDGGSHGPLYGRGHGRGRGPHGLRRRN